MKHIRLFLALAALIAAVAFVAGCTTAPAPAAPHEPAAPATSAVPAPASVTVPAPRAWDIDRSVAVRFNDYACLDVQQELDKEYLYPNEKFTLSAAPPGISGVNVNILFLDENDQRGFRQIKPAWDVVQRRWVYEGIVPLVQFNDITGSVEKTFSIKAQSKYFICVDDRKETGVNDAMLMVPVRLKRL